MEKIILPGADLRYYPEWLNKNDSEKLLAEFINVLPWQQPCINIAGRKIKIPRKQVWMGDEGSVMRYSGNTFHPEPWIPEIESIRLNLEKVSNTSFNSVLVNLYRDGNDSVSWHSDDEVELGANPVIASLSLGASRRFSLKPKSKGQKPLHIQLQAGDLLLMVGETQHHWQHCIQKDKALLGLPNTERINLTFRHIIL